MGYYIYDVNGYVGDLGSNTWVAQLSVRSENGPKTVRDFFENGQQAITPQFLEDLQFINDPDLLTLISKCEEIAIITDGVGLEEDPGALPEEIQK